MAFTEASTDNRLEAFLRIVEVANRSLDIRSVLAASVEELVAEIPADVVLVLLPDGRGTTLETAYQARIRPIGGRERLPSFPIGNTVYGRVLRSLRPAVLDDVAAGLGDGPLGGDVPLRSVAVLPLTRAGVGVGVLAVGSGQPTAFPEPVVRQLKRFASLIGLATSNARLHNEARRRTRQLVALNRLSSAVAGTLSSAGVLAAAMEHVEDAIGLTAPSVYGFDATGRRLERLTGRGLSDGARAATASLPLYGERTNLVQALQRLRPLVWWLREEPLADIRELTALRDDGFRTFVMVPLTAHGQVRGALAAASREDRSLEAGNEAILMAAGSQIGAALRNAELHEGLRGDADRLQRLVEERTEAVTSSNKRLRYVTSWLTHDLKRPMRSIRALTELLAEDTASLLSEDQRRMIGRILDAAERMSGRLADLLELVQVGLTELHPQPCALARALYRTLDGLAEHLATSGIRVVHTAPWPDGLVDRRFADRLVEHLVFGMMHVVEGSPPATLRFGARGGAPTTYVIEEKRAGSPSTTRRPPGEFSRTDPAEGGMNAETIRVVMAREILEAHGGRMWCEPLEDGGSALLFELPCGS